MTPDSPGAASSRRRPSTISGSAKAPSSAAPIANPPSSRSSSSRSGGAIASSIACAPSNQPEAAIRITSAGSCSRGSPKRYASVAAVHDADSTIALSSGEWRSATTPPASPPTSANASARGRYGTPARLQAPGRRQSSGKPSKTAGGLAESAIRGPPSIGRNCGDSPRHRGTVPVTKGQSPSRNVTRAEVAIGDTDVDCDGDLRSGDFARSATARVATAA